MKFYSNQTVAMQTKQSMPLRECWSSMELNLCLKCSGALGFLAKSPPACLSLLYKAAFSPVEQCGDNAGRIPMLPASSCWQKHFFWFSQFPRMTVLTKLVVKEDLAYFENQLLSGVSDTWRFGNVKRQGPSCWKSNNPDRTQTAAESGLTLISRQVKRWFFVIKDNISSNSFML